MILGISEYVLTFALSVVSSKYVFLCLSPSPPSLLSLSHTHTHFSFSPSNHRRCFRQDTELTFCARSREETERKEKESRQNPTKCFSSLRLCLVFVWVCVYVYMCVYVCMCVCMCVCLSKFVARLVDPHHRYKRHMKGYSHGRGGRDDI